MKPPANVRNLDTGLKSQDLPKPPENLSEAACNWWNDLMAEYILDDSAARLLLETAMRCFDRASEASELLNREGLTQADRFGIQKTHPACIVERDMRSQMMVALKALNLDLEIPNKPGRPSTSV